MILSIVTTGGAVQLREDREGSTIVGFRCRGAVRRVAGQARPRGGSASKKQKRRRRQFSDFTAEDFPDANKSKNNQASMAISM